MSHLVTRAGFTRPVTPPNNAAYIERGPAVQFAPVSGDSISGSAQSVQNGPAPGWCEWITNQLRALWDAICSCFSSKAPAAAVAIAPLEEVVETISFIEVADTILIDEETGLSVAALEERIKDCNQAIADHWKLVPKSPPNPTGMSGRRQFAVVTLTYNRETVCCGVREIALPGMHEPFETFLKKRAAQFLRTKSVADQHLLGIQTYFMTQHSPTECYWSPPLKSELDMQAHKCTEIELNRYPRIDPKLTSGVDYNYLTLNREDVLKKLMPLANGKGEIEKGIQQVIAAMFTQ